MSRTGGAEARLVLEGFRESSKNKSAPSLGMGELRAVFTLLFVGLQSHISKFVMSKSK